MKTFGSNIPALITWATQLKAVAQDRNDKVAAKSIQQEIDELKAGRFMLVVMGKVKRGKSTFCNAFLGRQNDQVAPVDKLPASSVISKFFQGPEEKVGIFYRDGRTENSSYSQIIEFVTEERNPENCKEVQFLEISGPFAELQDNITLVDTPGSGSIHKQHDIILQGFIPQADAVIFLVTADMPIAADELEMLRQLKQHDIKKVFFAINKVDACDEKEIQDGIDHNVKMLGAAGIPVGKIHRISTKQAMQGNMKESGLPEFLSEISAFIAQNRLPILQGNFVSKVNQAAGSLAQSIALEMASSEQSEGELQKELATLMQTKREVTADREGVEREFDFKWRSAVDDLDASLADAEQQVKDAALTHIRDCPAMKADKLKKEMPDFLAKSFEEKLASHSAKFEASAREAVEKMRVSYPALKIDPAGGLLLKVGSHQSTLLKGFAWGTVLASAGFGAVSAAASVSAAIAASAATAAAAASTAATMGTITTLLGVGSGLATGGLSTFLSLAGGVTGLLVPTVPAVATAPVWLAFAGPVGWALLGAGALCVPLAFRLKGVKLKEKIEEATILQISEIFGFIKKERIPQLRKLGARIVEESQIKLQNDLRQIENALQAALGRKQSKQDAVDLTPLAKKLKAAIEQSTQFNNAGENIALA